MTDVSPTSKDWTDQAVDAIESAVSTVREKAVGPAQRLTSNVVFGVIVAFFAIPALVLVGIAGFRVVDNYLPGDTWGAWLLFGGIFLAGGAFVWSKRHPRRA